MISTAATSFMRSGTEVIGMKHGYSSLADFSTAQPLVEGRDYVRITPDFLKRTRSGQGIMLGTARTNPGKHVSSPAHFDDSQRVQPLKNVYEGLRSLGVEALISIGGIGTRDAVLLLFLRRYGYDDGQAIAISFLILGLNIANIFPGFLLWFRDPVPRADPADIDESTPGAALSATGGR